MNLSAAESVMQPQDRQKAVRILAKSIYRELSQQGYDERQIVAFATEIISEVTRGIATQSAND